MRTSLLTPNQASSPSSLFNPGGQEAAILAPSTAGLTGSPLCALVTSGESLGSDHKAHRASVIILVSPRSCCSCSHWALGFCWFSRKVLFPFFAD